MRRIAIALLSTCLLAACGQKGALYLPGDEREEVGSTAAAPAAVPAATDATTDDEATARTNRN